MCTTARQHCVWMQMSGTDHHHHHAVMCCHGWLAVMSWRTRERTRVTGLADTQTTYLHAQQAATKHANAWRP
jgi:hypothetical protein